MWAFGVMLYEMCFAFKPTVLKNYTYGKNKTNLIPFCLGSGPIPYEKRALRKVNKQFIPVIEGCLEMDPTKRMSC
jgi:serine/threonine protein kinase